VLADPVTSWNFLDQSLCTRDFAFFTCTNTYLMSTYYSSLWFTLYCIYVTVYFLS
jgi:hypothetical protein